MLNTLIVSGIGIILASLIGLVVGIAQLSSNWLVARIAETYVALFRNVPVLLQILFWDQAVFLRLPRVQDAITLPGPLYLTNRSVHTIGPQPTSTTLLWLIIIAIGVFVSLIVWYWLHQRQAHTGNPSPRLLIAVVIVGVAGLTGWLFLTPPPLSTSIPTIGRFNFEGGLELPRAYISLLLGLSLYTAAFIAENVRAGIQGVPKGQYEAARALGLRPSQRMRLVILPLALRIIIPPTTNQYLNLIKNSSLATAVGYPDLYQMSRTIVNNGGQLIPMIGLVMGSYLIISLTTSFLMNRYNRKISLQTK